MNWGCGDAPYIERRAAGREVGTSKHDQSYTKNRIDSSKKLGQRFLVTFHEYSRHVREQLCWHCHARTHLSHARQRQCARCRHKWSYQRRRLQLDLLSMFSRHFNAAQAAKALRISYRTAWNHFMQFERGLRQGDPASASTFRNNPLSKYRDVVALLNRCSEDTVISEIVYRTVVEPDLQRVNS